MQIVKKLDKKGTRGSTRSYSPAQLDKEIKKQEQIENIRKKEKASNGLTYNKASEIIHQATSSIWVIDEKTGKTRKANREEALDILKRQAESNPSTKGIYEKFKKAYDAQIELENKFPELKGDGQFHFSAATLKNIKNAMSKA